MDASITRCASFKCEANRKGPQSQLHYYLSFVYQSLSGYGNKAPQLEERQQKRRPEYSKKTSFVWTASYSGQT